MRYTPSVMEEMTPADKVALINAIAAREGTAKQIATWYGYAVATLRQFTKDYKAEIVKARKELEESEVSEQGDREPTPNELSELWIADKNERLRRYQKVADKLYMDIIEGGIDAITLREFRSYLVGAANELGQLLHRGAGETGTDTLSVDFQGIDIENLK